MEVLDISELLLEEIYPLSLCSQDNQQQELSKTLKII